MTRPPRRRPKLPTVAEIGELIAKESASLKLSRPADPLLTLLAAHIVGLLRWNATINLTAIRDPREIVRRHTLEALAALPYLEGTAEGSLLVDVGSGNGYPALPLLMALPTLRGTLVETRTAKTAFLHAVLRETGLLQRCTLDGTRIDHPRNLPAEAVILTLRGFPDPEGWIAATHEHPGLRIVLAWLARDTATQLAAAVEQHWGQVRVRPLPTHPQGALLMLRR